MKEMLPNQIPSVLLAKEENQLNWNEVLEKLKKHGIDVWASFIFGFPGETEHTIKNTTDFIVSRNFDVLDLHALQVVPGTPLDLNREKVKYVQTPQGFNYNLIYSAYKNIQENINIFSDNMSTLISHNPKVNYKFINGESSNFKITTIEDINKAKILLK